jgi:flagellar basal body-associated protein FliL
MKTRRKKKKKISFIVVVALDVFLCGAICYLFRYRFSSLNPLGIVLAPFDIEDSARDLLALAFLQKKKKKTTSRMFNG